MRTPEHWLKKVAFFKDTTLLVGDNFEESVYSINRYNYVFLKHTIRHRNREIKILLPVL
jgi:hypothetical protein